MLIALVAGLVMGFASSLHCAGMCGPIGCALMLSNRRLDPMISIMVAQAGKLGAYVGLGALFGIFGAGFYGIANLHEARLVVQWSASLTILWMALSTFGLVPAMAGLDRIFAPLAGATARVRASWSAHGYGGIAVAGLVWGAAPCAMVYAALFNSLLAGSWLAGTAMMAGFALGTVPAVTSASTGLFHLGRSTASGRGKWFAGTALAAAGVLGLFLTVPGSPLCLGS